MLRSHRLSRIASALFVLFCLVGTLAAAAGPLSFERLAALRSVREVAISPDGSLAAYVLEVPRRPGVDEDGTAYRELHVVPLDGGTSLPYVTGEVRVSAIRFTPDSSAVTYLSKRGDDEKTTLWAIPVGGGESVRWVAFDENVRSYAVSPDGSRLAFIADEPADEGRKTAQEKGYDEIVFEEDWRPRRLWMVATPRHAEASDPDSESEESEESKESNEPAEPRAIETAGSAYGLAFSADGRRLATSVAPRALIDDQYMRRRIQTIDVATSETVGILPNSGKLGEFALSPDGSRVAFITARDLNDTKDGRLRVAEAGGGTPRELLPDFEGHVSHLAWQDIGTVVYVADVHTETVFGEVDIQSLETKTHATSGAGSPILLGMSMTPDGTAAVFPGETPGHPRELFAMRHGDEAPTRLTDSNPWLANVELARQEVVTHKASDGLALEGILIHPLKTDGKPAPLILIVHGGPESHNRNGWVTNYSRPGQLAAGQGYAVFYPNYRGSTGRGVEFALTSQGDPAGKEFRDLVDAVDHLVKSGVADRDRVGVTGGSYGGYATGWCSTRYTEHFRAGVMFVGIGNKLSAALTSEIPNELTLVHNRYDPWTRWDFTLERSPIFHADKSRTALLIAGGDADPRVNPAQSLQLYRALKLIDKTPVRLVQYPGEEHGNTRAASRDDFARRLMRWFDHFLLTDSRELPPWQLPHETIEEDSGES